MRLFASYIFVVDAAVFGFDFQVLLANNKKLTVNRIS